MSNPSDKAKWDALAEMLGAKVNQTEDPLQPRQETKVVPRVQLDLPHAPRKKAADWNSLANELGAEVTDHSEPPDVAPPALSRADRDRDRPRRSVRPAPQVEDGPEGNAVAQAIPETLGTAIPTQADSGDLPEADLPVADQSLDSESERRPRRRRRRGQRHRDDAGGVRSFRRDPEPEPDEPRHSERSASRELVDREESGAGTKRAGHKSVPSWSEAISLMIDGNLANRSTRRRSGPNGGRTRGRRGIKRT